MTFEPAVDPKMSDILPPNQSLVPIQDRPKHGRPKGSKDKRKRRKPRRAGTPETVLRNQVRQEFEAKLAEGQIVAGITGSPNKSHKKPKYVPSDFDRTITKCLAMLGNNSDVIGQILGVDGRDIRREYSVELRQTKDIATALVAGNLFKQAIKDNPRAVPAALGWLAKIAGIADKSEVSGPGGGPIKSESAVFSFQMTIHPGDENI